MSSIYNKKRRAYLVLEENGDLVAYCFATDPDSAKRATMGGGIYGYEEEDIRNATVEHVPLLQGFADIIGGTYFLKHTEAKYGNYSRNYRFLRYMGLIFDRGVEQRPYDTIQYEAKPYGGYGWWSAVKAAQDYPRNLQRLANLMKSGEEIKLARRLQRAFEGAAKAIDKEIEEKQLWR